MDSKLVSEKDDGDAKGSFAALDHDNRHEESQINQLATHLPDMVVFADHSRNFPYQTTLQGVLMFLDISGKHETVTFPNSYIF